MLLMVANKRGRKKHSFINQKVMDVSISTDLLDSFFWQKTVVVKHWLHSVTIVVVVLPF